MRNTRRHRGIFMADAVMALALVAIVGILLAVSVNRQQRASNRLAESRASVSLAEQTLTSLQSGQSTPKVPEGAEIRVNRLDTPSGAGGLVWATVETKVDGRSASLTGLVRADAVNQGEIK